MNNQAEQGVTVEKATVGSTWITLALVVRKKQIPCKYTRVQLTKHRNSSSALASTGGSQPRAPHPPWEKEPKGKCGPAGQRPEEGNSNNDKLRKHHF